MADEFFNPIQAHTRFCISPRFGISNCRTIYRGWIKEYSKNSIYSDQYVWIYDAMNSFWNQLNFHNFYILPWRWASYITPKQKSLNEEWHHNFRCQENMLQWLNSPQSDIWSCIWLKWFLHILELKCIYGILCKFTWPGQLFYKGCELMMISSIIIELYLPDKFNFYTLVLQFWARFF